MICPNCSHNNEENVHFCAACGFPQPTPTAAPPAESIAPPVEQATPPAEQAVPPAQNYTSFAPTSMPYMPPQMMQQPPEKPVSLLKWLGIMALEMLCGIAHFVLMIVWAVSSKTTQNLKNYARAKLIMTGISLLLAVILIVVTVFCTSVFWDIASEFLYPREDPSFFEDPNDFSDYFEEDPYSYYDEYFYDEFSSWS